MNNPPLRNHFCKVCGRNFKSTDRSKYCSSGCYKKRPYAVQKIKCLQCDTMFRPRVHNGKRQVFCSIGCRWEHERENSSAHVITCKTCGKKFIVPPSRLKFGNPKFCSGECANNIKRSKNERFTRLKTKTWAEIRHGVIERDGGKCVICCTDRQLTVHHITPWIKSKDDSESNLVTLCRSCHHKVEYGIIEYTFKAY